MPFAETWALKAHRPQKWTQKFLNPIAFGTLYLAFVSQARTYPRLDASLSKKMPHSKS